MNSLMQLKQTTSVFLLTLAWFGFLPQMQAAPDALPPPPPDGCYPGYTTAEGCNALIHLTSGAGNTGMGWHALSSDSSGNFNTGVGAGTLVLNNADSNTAVGAAALLLNTSGGLNTAVGTDALVHNDVGDSNTAVGAFALFTNAGTGISNNAVGRQALTNNTTGSFNQAVGVNALGANTTGTNNVAIGDDAMLHSTTSSANVVIGQSAGGNIATFGGNIYIGAGAGGPSDEVAFIRIGVPTIMGFPYDCYIAGINGRGVDAGTAHLVYADGNQKIGTVLVNANGNKVPFKPQAMLDESLKQQKRIAELEATVERQQKGMEVLTAQLREQAAQIQKVSVQFEASKPAPQVVNNP
jgi:hypothetical protein